MQDITDSSTDLVSLKQKSALRRPSSTLHTHFPNTQTSRAVVTSQALEPHCLVQNLTPPLPGMGREAH